VSISYQIDVGGDIDGVTVIDVTNFQAAPNGVRQVAVAGPGGIVQLASIPGIGFEDAWVQVAFITPTDAGATMRYALRTSEGAEQDIPINVPTSDYESPWNILCPQNSDLVLEITASPTFLSGVIFFNVWSLNTGVWPELNGNHVFSNLPTPPPV
jgi:hypothetical protein